jgi:hypothetical protein
MRKAFHVAVDAGLAAAVDGAMITFGIVPDRPETGYGYIRAVSEIAEDLREVGEFVEKPDAATAERYVASGEYLWNSGIFMVRASVWLRAIECFNPAMAEACQEGLCVGGARCRFRPGGAGGLSRIAVGFDRLCGDGEAGRSAGTGHRPPRGADVGRMVGCRRVGCAVVPG